MNVKLTTTHGKEVLVNWDNVSYVKGTASHFGDVYTEVYFSNDTLDIKESVEEVGVTLRNQST